MMSASVKKQQESMTHKPKMPWFGITGRFKIDLIKEITAF